MSSLPPAREKLLLRKMRLELDKLQREADLANGLVVPVAAVLAEITPGVQAGRRILETMPDRVVQALGKKLNAADSRKVRETLERVVNDVERAIATKWDARLDDLTNKKQVL